MPDIEKVIKGLECIAGDAFLCCDCAFSDKDGFGSYTCKAECAKNAIALLKEQQHQIWELQEVNEHLNDLLKEQEAVEPILIREGRNKYYNDYVCPRCDNEVVYEQNYCSECGIPFLWKGR